MYRLLSIMMLVLVPCVHTLSAVDKEGALTAAIEEVRQNLAAKLGKTIPSINVLINTPAGCFGNRLSHLCGYDGKRKFHRGNAGGIVSIRLARP